MGHPSTLENQYSNIFFYKTFAPTVLKFYMEHDLAPGSQNYKIGSGRISKMAAIPKNSKNNKISFFSRTNGYFGLYFGMEYQWNIRIQNYKNEKNLKYSFVTVTYFLFTSVMLLYLKITYLNIFKQPFFSKTTEAIVVKFHLNYDRTPGFQNYKFGLGQESKMAAVIKNSKNIKINFFSGTIRYNWL